MSPLPDWKIIPAGWQERHAPALDGTRTADALFLRISSGPAPYPLPEGWDGTEQIWGTPEKPIQVRVQQLNRDGAGVAADQAIYLREYMVTAPKAGPEIRAGEQGDVIHVLGRRLRITSELLGSMTFERVFVCVDNLTQHNP